MMRKVFFALTRRASPCLFPSTTPKILPLNFTSELGNPKTANFTSMIATDLRKPFSWTEKSRCSNFLEPQRISHDSVRTVIKYSLKKGKRKSVKAVINRFYRLHWGCWIRTFAGRYKKLWRKPYKRRNRLQYHVFCNATQSKNLDKMVNKFWKKPRYYINDPYEIYNSREEFWITRKKPWRPEGVDYE